MSWTRCQYGQIPLHDVQTSEYLFCVYVCLDAFGSLLDEAGWLFEGTSVIACVSRLPKRVEEQDLGIYSTGN